MTLTRTHLSLIGVGALLFVLVFAPVEISKALLSMASTAAVIGAIAGGIYFVHKSMKKQENSAKKLVAGLAASLARVEKAAQDLPHNDLADNNLRNARHHLNVALQYNADGEFSDAERSAESGRTSLGLVCNMLGLTDEFAQSLSTVTSAE